MRTVRSKENYESLCILLTFDRFRLASAPLSSHWTFRYGGYKAGTGLSGTWTLQLAETPF